MRIEDRIAAIKRKVAQEELTVLIWGPGDTGGADFAKRQKIRETIETEFPHSEVLFSEDVPASASEMSILSVPERELWHLAACDLCVVLDTSKGAGEEIAHFCQTSHTHKLIVLTHEHYRNAATFPGEIRKRLRQIFYSDAEYNACHLVEHVVTIVRQEALRRHLRP